VPARFKLAHRLDRRLQRGAGVARTGLRSLGGLGQLGKFGIDASQSRLCRFELAPLPLQLAGEFRHAAMRKVQAALRVLALLLGIHQPGTQLGELGVELGFALRQPFDVLAQPVDLALARQRAVLRLAGADQPQPPRADPLAIAGDAGAAIFRRNVALRGIQRFQCIDACQQPARRGRAGDLGRQ
jgi:hypothetical protein